MKRIKVFFGELVFQKGPEHTLRIIFVGCIALSVAAVLLGLFMLLPPAAVQAEDTPSATVDENPQQGSEAPRSESGLGQSHPVPGEPRSESEVTSFQGPQQAMGQLPEPAGGQPEGPSSGVEERGQLKKLMDGGMNRAQAGQFLAGKEQLAMDSSAIISCVWREEQGDYYVTTDALRSFGMKNGGMELDAVQAYTVRFNGDKIMEMTDYNHLAVYHQGARVAGYRPFDLKAVEAAAGLLQPALDEVFSKQMWVPSVPAGEQLEGRLVEGTDRMEHQNHAEVSILDRCLVLNGFFVLIRPDAPAEGQGQMEALPFEMHFHESLLQPDGTVNAPALCCVKIGGETVFIDTQLCPHGTEGGTK